MNIPTQTEFFNYLFLLKINEWFSIGSSETKQNMPLQKAIFAHLHQIPTCVRSLSTKRQIPSGLSF